MINYTVKLILRDQSPNDKGECPIYIRITVARKSAYTATGHFVHPKQWNAKTETIKEINPNAKTLNPELSFRKQEVIKKIVSLQVAHKDFTAKSIKESFNGKDLNNIFNFIDKFCEEVKHKKAHRSIVAYQQHARKLEKFHGSRELNFEDITPQFLGKFEKHLRETDSNNYIHNTWKKLKTFFNAARKRKLITNYPFEQYENPVYRDPQKDYLNLEELAKWEKFADETDNPIYRQAAVYFLFGAYSGLRISDWRTFDIKTHVIGENIKLRAKKNSEWLSIPINGPLARNIERMRKTAFEIEEQTLNEKLKIICKSLGINKKLSSHCGRKTFAVTMCADRGISLEVCAELMGITVMVCHKNYYKITDYKIRNEVLKAWSGL